MASQYSEVANSFSCRRGGERQRREPWSPWLISAVRYIISLEWSCQKKTGVIRVYGLHRWAHGFVWFWITPVFYLIICPARRSCEGREDTRIKEQLFVRCVDYVFDTPRLAPRRKPPLLLKRGLARDTPSGEFVLPPRKRAAKTRALKAADEFSLHATSSVWCAHGTH